VLKVPTKISIIIPTYNEASRIQATLKTCLPTAGIETIVVDGGSDDGTAEIAAALGTKVFSSQKGRGRQMNLAAQRASGEILLFLHADTHLPEGFAHKVAVALENPDIAGGAFRLRIDGNALSFRLIELGVLLRSRILKAPYGDQALFVRSETFERLNGFKEMPILEDLDLVRRLRKMGRLTILDACVVTSARRWNEVGRLRTTLINQIVVFAYLVGRSPEHIAAFYRGERSLP
jgi:rSAM/selenodomain-associated transferase 2